MRFLEVIGSWINRHFSNEEAIYLVVFCVVVFTLLFTLGGVLAPVLTGLVIAFLLVGLVERLKAFRVPELAAVSIAFVLFLSVMIALLVILVPLLVRQTQALVAALPNIMERLQEASRQLLEAFPDMVTPEQTNTWMESAAGQVGVISTNALELVLGGVPSLVGLLIYVVLVPISVFFFLKDRHQLKEFFGSLLPERRPVLTAVGVEMNAQLANYVRGKFIEILIVGSATFITLSFLGLNYAALLGVLVGLSVLIPFVGAAVVTVPVLIVGILQFGWSWDLTYVMIAYGIIQALDGNVLVPLLFSEAVDLHPITIIVAVLAFGGLWGVWGVFFAIPLATLVKAIYNAWPDEHLAEAAPGRLGADPADTKL